MNTIENILNKYKEKIPKLDWHTIKSIMFFFVVGLVFSLWLKRSFNSDLMVSLKRGYLIWTVVYFLFLFKYFWIIPRGNYGIALQNYLTRVFIVEAEKEEEKSDELYLPRGQRVCFSPSGRWPWELPFRPAIHMAKSFPISGKITVTDMNGYNYTLEFDIATTPIRSRWLLRFFLVEDGAAETSFKGLIEPTIREEFARENGENIRKKLVGFSKSLYERVYGGDKIDDAEKKNGRAVTNILVKSVVPDEDTQKTLRLQSVISSVADGIGKFRKEHVSPDIAANLAAGIQGGADVQAINIAGISGGQKGKQPNVFVEVNVGKKKDKKT